MNRIPIPMRAFFVWGGVAALALGIFIDITKDLLEGDVDAIDRAIMLFVAKAREPWLNLAAVDLTALGSITLVVLFSACTFVVLLMLRDRMGAIQLLTALSGAAIFTEAIKSIIERARPEVIPHLVEVSGSSYPSGHSLAAASAYLTIAVIARRHLQPRRPERQFSWWPDCSLCWLVSHAYIWAFITRPMSLALLVSAARGHSCLPLASRSQNGEPELPPIPKMIRSNQRSVVAALLKLYGRTFAEDLGIDAKQNEPSPLFCLLISALLFSTRINHNIALQTARILFERGWTTPERMAATTWEQRVRALDEGGYVRYDERTSTMLGETSQMLIDLYQADLRSLRTAAKADPAQERRLLDRFKGIGEIAVNIFFLRESQLAWPELFPFSDQKALDGAKGLGLPTEVHKLAGSRPRPPELCQARIGAGPGAIGAQTGRGPCGGTEMIWRRTCSGEGHGD